MTLTARKRVFIDLALVGDSDENSDLVERIVEGVGQMIDDPNGALDSWEAGVVPDDGTPVIVTGNPVDGIALHGPVPAEFVDDVSLITSEGLFDGEDWWFTTVEPWPYRDVG